MTYRRKITLAVICFSIVLCPAIDGFRRAYAENEEDVLSFFPSANPVLPPLSTDARPPADTTSGPEARPTPADRPASIPSPATTPRTVPVVDPDSPHRTSSVIPSLGAPRPPVTSINSSLTQARQLSQAFRVAADKVKPTVVTIRTGKSLGTISQDSNSQFENWTNDPNRSLNMSPDESIGSGVVVDSKGIILTNYHVLSDSAVIVVELPNGRQFESTQVRYDEETDLAVIWIDTKDPLPSATLGDSDSMEVGDWVLAIGSPFGLNQTVSAGIISGKSRSLNQHSGSRFLQTDAAINPGNSGGPLVNLDGQVIGINTAIASNTGGYQGIGFAIPSNLAYWVMRQLIEHGSVRRGFLGVAVSGINSNIAQRFDVKPGSGVIVTDVYEDTPAAKAGLRTGDIITSFDGHSIRSQRDLRELIERSTGGDRRPLTIIRDGEEQEVQVVFAQEGEVFDESNLPPAITSSTDDYISRDLGFSATRLTPEIAKRLEVEDLEGVLINQIAERGSAHRESLSAGDIILRVGRKEISSIKELTEAMESETPEKGVLFLIRTDMGNRFVVLRKVPN